MTTLRGNSLVSHPYRQWFNDQILEGYPINHIYSKQGPDGKIPPELHVSKRTISEYRNNILKANTTIVEQFQQEKKIEMEQEVHQEIIQDPAVKEIIDQKTNLMINADDTFLDMHAQLKDQIMKLASIDDPLTRSKIGIAEVIGQLVDQLRLVTMDFLKVQGRYQETPQTQINIINIEKNNAEMEALKSSIIDILGMIDPSLLPRFYDLLNQKVQTVNQTFELKKKNMSNAPQISEDEATVTVNHLIAAANKIKGEE